VPAPAEVRAGVLVGINVDELEFNRFVATILILSGVPLLLR
jgi:hypothetical protein